MIKRAEKSIGGLISWLEEGLIRWWDWKEGGDVENTFKLLAGEDEREERLRRKNVIARNEVTKQSRRKL